MRVLIQPRPAAPVRQGGDWLHLQAVLEPLRALGVQAEISTDVHASLEGFDLCLIWSAVEPQLALPYLFNAWRQDKRVAFMPIYWTLTRLWKADAALRGMDANEAMREMEHLQRERYMALEKILVRGADVLTPNSESEAERLYQDFGVPRERMHVSHYGTTNNFADGKAERFREFVDAPEFVLSVGLIGPRKNQLNLIRALRDLERPLVLLGDVENEAYAQECRKAAAQNRARVYFVPRKPQEVVADAYAAARVHAIISLHDIGPLVALEAAVAGVPQVVTTECSMQNYLGAPTVFVDPEDLGAIADAVKRVENEPRTQALSQQLLRTWTWTRAAKELRAGLEWVLAQPRAAYDPFPEMMRSEELLERQVECLWRALGTQTENARRVETWAHELNAQLQAQRSLGARVKALVGK